MNQIWLNAVRASAGASLDPDAATLIAAMTTAPDATRQQLISDHIVALKAAGIWSQLDTYYMMAAHHEQASRLNWKSPGNFTLSTHGTITFTTDRGWQGDGSTGYLDTGWIPSSHGVNHALNSASYGVYSRTNSQQNGFDMGAETNILFDYSRMTLRNTSNQGRAHVNQATSFPRPSMMDSRGLILSRRSASNAVAMFRNGSSVGGDDAVSTGLPNVAFAISATNRAGTVVDFASKQYSLAFTAAAMSEAQHAALYAAMQNGYLAAVGAAL